jgi:cobalt-zinc-cadmium efflux system outer membrane protein
MPRPLKEIALPRQVHAIATFALLIGVSGCASASKDNAFKPVQRLTSERTGHLVQWDQHGADDQAVRTAVDAMLAKSLMVDQAVQIALLNNRHLQATFEDLGIAQADLVQAGLLKNPVFAASWRFPDRNPGGTNIEYSVAQDFLDLLIIPLRKQVAAQQLESTKFSVAHDVLQLAADVKVAYFTFQAREQLLGRLQVIVEINQTAAELARRQYEAGTLNELGAANQQAIYEQSQADEAQTEAQLTADRERLNRLLGLWGEQTAWKIAAQLPEIPRREISIEHLESLAMRDRLDLAATRAQVVSLAYALNLTTDYRWFTNVDVGVDTEREPGGQHVTGPTLSLQVPIFDQGQARVQKVQAQFRQLHRRLEALAIDVRSEVREARDRMLAERKLAEHYKVMLPERIRILNLTLQQYNGMLKGPYDLLLAKQNEVATEQAYIDAWRDYWIARSELERAVGGRLPAETISATQPSGKN